MDMCEYMWSNEMAMRRLLNMVSRFFIFSPKIFSHNYVIVTQLRHGQSYCTDTECIDRKFEKMKFTFINFLHFFHSACSSSDSSRRCSVGRRKQFPYDDRALGCSRYVVRNATEYDSWKRPQSNEWQR